MEYGTLSGNHQQCQFEEHAQITRVEMHFARTDQNIQVIYGMNFSMSDGSNCDMVRQEKEEMMYTQGHQLLYFTGKWGSIILRRVHFHYDYDCHSWE